VITTFHSLKQRKCSAIPNQIVAEKYFVEGEQRYQIIGMTKGLVLLLVVYVDHSNPNAVALEEELYEEQIS
jgi:uncharacterized DUF497 family protein